MHAVTMLYHLSQYTSISQSHSVSQHTVLNYCYQPMLSFSVALFSAVTCYLLSTYLLIPTYHTCHPSGPQCCVAAMQLTCLSVTSLVRCSVRCSDRLTVCSVVCTSRWGATRYSLLELKASCAVSLRLIALLLDVKAAPGKYPSYLPGEIPKYLLNYYRSCQYLF